MHGSGIFKIVIGDSWREAVSDRANKAFPRKEEHIDFGRIRDWVEIVVGGKSISEKTDEDSIFYLMRDLLLAVNQLREGSTNARVSYYNGPWELVIQRLGADALLTFYRAGHQPEVIIKDHRIGMSELSQGVVSASLKLEQMAISLDPAADRDPLVGMIQQLRADIEVGINEGQTFEPAIAQETQGIMSSRWLKPREGNDFSFGFKFQATATDVMSNEDVSGSDLNSLLFKGNLACHTKSKRLVFGKGFLLLQSERLLHALRQLLGAWEEGRPVSLRMMSGGMSFDVRLSKDDGFTIGLEDNSREDAIIRLEDISLWDFADAVLGVGRELRRKVIELNFSQRRNLRLVELSREIRQLSNWAKSLRKETVINLDVDRYRQFTETRRSPVSTAAISDVSRLRFQENWRLEVEGLDLQNTMLCGDVTMVAARGGLIGLDAARGEVIWRRETDQENYRVQMADRDGVVRVNLGGQVDYLDLLSGVARWSTRLAPRSGGAPVLLVAEQGASPGVVITAEEEHRLVALDVRTGEPRWRFNTNRGSRFSLRRYGRLLYVVGGDNQLQAIDLNDGSLVWRNSERSKFIVPPAIAGDTLLMPGGRPGARDGKLVALDAFSGERRWQTSIEGGAVTSPAIAGKTALLAVRNGNRQELLAVNVDNGDELWRYSCQGWAESCALLAMDDSFIINSAGGVVRSLDAQTGEERWMTVLGPVCSEDVPLGLRVVLRGGALFVPADTVYVVRPDDGNIIHSFGGEPPVPDMLHVDPACNVLIAEESGHIGSFGLAHRFGVVQGGITH